MNRTEQVALLKQAAFDAIQPLAMAKKSAYDTEAIETNMLQGMTLEAATQQTIQRGTELSADYEIYFHQLRVFASLKAISENPEKFDKQPCADPLDKSHRGIFFWNDGKTPCLFSQNDGGTSYSFEGKNFSGSSKLPNHVPNVPNVPTTESLDAAVLEIERVLVDGKDKPELYGSPKFLKALEIIGTNPELRIKYRVEIKNSKNSGVPMSLINNALMMPKGDNGSGESIASGLIALVEDSCELIHDSNSDAAFADVDVNGVLHTLRVGGKAFSDWLSYAYYKSTKMETGSGVSASEAAIKQAGFALAGIAKHEGVQDRVHLRVAAHNGGYIIYLGDDRRRVVEVTAGVWRVLDKSPVRFHQPPAMQSLPIPETSGDLSQLWDFINIHVDDRLLFLAWLLECLRPESPFPILSLTGLQGSAKSTTLENLRQLIDPSAVNCRAAPKSVEDVYVGAGCNWVASFENISHLSAGLQDALCTMATGGGFASRTLYTNSEETVIEVCRPIVLNSIPHVLTAQDSIDRAIVLECPTLPGYLDAVDLKARWEIAKPGIFGGLMDLFVKTLALLPTVKLDKPSRMADFNRLGEAMAQALGHEPGEFDRVYKANRSENMAAGLESSPAAAAVRDLAFRHFDDRTDVVFFDTFKSLYELLTSDKAHRLEGWPKSPKGLADALRRQHSALLALGIKVEHGTHREYTASGRGISVKITKLF